MVFGVFIYLIDPIMHDLIKKNSGMKVLQKFHISIQKNVELSFTLKEQQVFGHAFLL